MRMRNVPVDRKEETRVFSDTRFGGIQLAAEMAVHPPPPLKFSSDMYQQRRWNGEAQGEGQGSMDHTCLTLGRLLEASLSAWPFWSVWSFRYTGAASLREFVLKRGGAKRKILIEV